MHISNAQEFKDLTTPVPLSAKYHLAKGGTQVVRLSTAQNLFRDGDQACKVYEVVAGVLRLTTILEDGRRQVIAFGYPGDIVGFPRDGLYNAECDAISPAEVIAHSVSDLECGSQNPELHMRLVKAALNEIVTMRDQLTVLGKKTAAEKLASFLCVLMMRIGRPLGAYTHVNFPMTREDMADFLGLRFETVSRTLSQFRKQRIIALENSRAAVILDPDALSYMADMA